MAKSAKRKAGSKLFVLLMALIMLAEGVVIALAIGSKGFTIKDFGGYFNYWGKGSPIADDGENKDNEENKPNVGDGENKPSAPQTLDEGSLSIETQSISSPMTMAFASRASTVYESVVDITATITMPDGTVAEGELGAVEFTLEGTNSKDTAWQNAIDLIISDDARTATLACKGPFGQRLTLTAVSKVNPDIVMTANVNYLQRITSVSTEINGTKGTFTYNGGVQTINAQFTYNGYPSNMPEGYPNRTWYTENEKFCLFNGEYSTSTSSECSRYREITACAVSVTFSDEVKQALNAELPAYLPLEDIKSYVLNVAFEDNEPQAVYCYQGDIFKGIIWGDNNNDIFSSNYFTRVKNVIMQHSNQFKVTVEFSYDYGANSSITYFLNIPWNTPSNGSLSQTEIEF